MRCPAAFLMKHVVLLAATPPLEIRRGEPCLS
jgi:hypothetical protein